MKMGTRLHWAALGMAALFSLAAAAPPAIKNSDCLECHGDKTLTTTNAAGVVLSLFADTNVFHNSAHQNTACASCHNDLTVKHPDDNLAAKPVDCGRCHEAQMANYGAGAHAAARFQGDRLGTNQAPGCTDCHGTHGIRNPGSPSSSLYFVNVAKTCGRCHAEAARDVAASVHGKAIAAGHRDAATCTDCHAEHGTQKLAGESALQISQQVCSQCHASERLNTKYNLPADRVKTFFESYHGLAAQYGATRAANCASCHGIHKILPSSDPSSTIHKTHLRETCGKCHPGASAQFAEGRIHVNAAEAGLDGALGGKINWWVRKAYLAMIFTVIGLMAAHNLLIFGKKAAARARRAGRTALRMDANQRLQHLVLAASFIILAWTGFALKFPNSWVAVALGSNEAVRSWIHRGAAIVMLLAGFYHIGYVLGTREGRRLVLDLAPRPQDLRDAAANARYLTGMSRIKPAIGRFGYAEKMEYWAVVWGTIIMGTSGLMIWFKLGVTRYLPRWAVEVATTVHYYEAILACLAIVVWHFYHVIFDPDVYPLNRAALDGRVPEEWLEEEHPLAAPAHGRVPASEEEDTTATH